MPRTAAKGLFHPKTKAWRARLPLEQTSEMGHSRRNRTVRVMSGLPPTATQEPTFRLGSFVPQRTSDGRKHDVSLSYINPGNIKLV